MATSYADDPEDAVRADVRRHAAWALSSASPVDVDGLLRMLTNAGVFESLDGPAWDTDDHRAMVEDLVRFDFEDFHGTADGLIAHVPSLVDGTTLTHVLTTDERRRSMIDLGVDLTVLDRYRFRYELASGEDVRVVYDDDSFDDVDASTLGLSTGERAHRDGSLVGPDGWLDRFAAGDLVAVRVRSCTLEITPAGGAPSVPALDAALVTGLERAARLRIDEPIRGDDGRFLLMDGPAHLVLDALAHEPVLLRVPGRPLSAVFDALGLSWDGEHLLWRPPSP